jgi:dihydroxyacetone kinase-like protein
MSEGFKAVSDVLIKKIGGSMGPLYSSFFRGLFIESRKYKKVDKIVILGMLEKAYSNIYMISNAKVNDKTLIDVLDPSIKSYKEAVENDKVLISSLGIMMQAANEGVEATKSMGANIGKAARLGERSVGQQDAGATSCALILNAFGNSVI